jgi:hypothetical protein
MVRLADLACETYVDRLAREYREIVMAACSVEGIELYARFRSEADVGADIAEVCTPRWPLEAGRAHAVDRGAERLLRRLGQR